MKRTTSTVALAIAALSLSGCSLLPSAEQGAAPSTAEPTPVIVAVPLSTPEATPAAEAAPSDAGTVATRPAAPTDGVSACESVKAAFAQFTSEAQTMSPTMSEEEQKEYLVQMTVRMQGVYAGAVAVTEGELQTTFELNRISWAEFEKVISESPADPTALPTEEQIQLSSRTNIAALVIRENSGLAAAAYTPLGVEITPAF